MSGIMLETSETKRGNPGLKTLREELGLERQEIAKAVGVSTRQWQRYENDGELPEKASVFIRLAVLAGKSVDAVIQQSGYPIPTKEELMAQIKSA